MLQRLIHNARVNMFESARFYSIVFLVLMAHLLLRHFLLKFSYLNFHNEWIESKYVAGILYFTVLIIIVIRFTFLNKINFLFWLWLALVFVCIFNEVNFILSVPNFSYKSIFYGQSYIYFSYSFPLLFMALVETLKPPLNYSKLFYILEACVLINCILTLIGWIFDITFFESYPNSGRWGYSGFLTRAVCVFLSSIVLINSLEKNQSKIKIVLIFLTLFLTGTKMGLLSVFLIIIYYLKTYRLRAIAGVLGSFMLILILYTLNHFPNAFPFLGSVYENHGAFGLITSLRNQLLIEDIGVFINDYNFKSIMIGGDMRYPEIRSEVLIFDIFWWMGLVGIIIYFVFFRFYVRKIKLLIPFIPAIATGFFSPVCIIFYCLWIRHINIE